MSRHHLQRRFIILTVIWACLLPPLVHSEETGETASETDSELPSRHWDEGTVNLQIENDLFGNGADRNFTNGIRLSYLTSLRRGIPDILKPLLPFIPDFGEETGTERRSSYSLGQNMYTPSDISRPELIPGERPYAGWLYAGFGIVSKTDNSNRPDKLFNRMDNLEINIGIVGPASLAGTFQRTWHKWFDFQPPRGWGNQLDNEPGIVLVYERQWRIKEKAEFAGIEADFTPRAGAALGNVFTYASAGATIRIGPNLPNDYGPPRIRPSLPGSGFFDPRSTYSLYFFTGVEGRAVARNIFLDGNTFSNSHHVDKKYLVGDLQLGVVLTTDRIGFMPPLRISYTYILRSKEYRGQEKADKFGSINLSFNI